MNNGRSNFQLYAPNVHTGGGFVLLRALLAAWPEHRQLSAILDARARDRLVLPAGTQVSWVLATAASRLKAELDLRTSSSGGGTVFCFHGLPPLFSSPARVIVFLQNRLHLEKLASEQFTWRTRARLAAERLIARMFRHRVSEYIVQTPAMLQAAVAWYGKEESPTRFRILPFVDDAPASSPATNGAVSWDFVYVADGVAHKNHRALLQAWQLLAQAGLRPSLALTLSKRDRDLSLEIAAVAREWSMQIHDLGELPRQAVMALYANARAMIFPSKSESFGLPLVEATRMGLPIIASELDFVREVCVPVQTFDPNSARSIARAVRRFLGAPEPCVELRDAAGFWRDLLTPDSRADF